MRLHIIVVPCAKAHEAELNSGSCLPPGLAWLVTQDRMSWRNRGEVGRGGLRCSVALRVGYELPLLCCGLLTTGALLCVRGCRGPEVICSSGSVGLGNEGAGIPGCCVGFILSV